MPIPNGVELLQPHHDLPPVGYVDRRRMPVPQRIIFAIIALVAAFGWAAIALRRGESVNATWLVLAAVGTYIVGYRFYGRLIEYKVVRPKDDRATPAELYNDGKNFMPTDRRVLFGHHFAAIAGAGPLVGPILAAQMGYLPGTIWIVFGAVFAGAVQDYLVLAISTRRKGRSLGQMLNDETGRVGGIFGIIGILVIMTILIAVLGVVIINALAESPWGVFSITMTIPIALFMGVYLRYIRPGRVSEVSLIGIGLLVLAIVAGGWVNADPFWHDVFLWDKVTLAWALIGYGFVASVLPVWLLLAPRDYLSTFMKIGVIGLLAIGILIVRPSIEMPAVTHFALDGTGPAFAGQLFPFLFITIACGALSGFHALVSSGTTPKLVEKESQMRMIGYGGMIMESFVAVMAMCAAVIIDQHLYFAMNASSALTGGAADTAAQYVNSLGLSSPDVSAEHFDAAAAAVGEASIVSRTGGAPTLAFGMSDILSQVFGGDALQSFWYHFAIMFEALFILTTIDAGTRVARFMLADAMGNVPGMAKFRDAGWTTGNVITSAVVCLGWGSILVMGVTDPLGGINMLFPLFGIANQLLAALALTLVTVVVVKRGYVKWAWIPGVPLTWDLIVTMTASWQKIFSDDPKIGYWALHSAFKDAQDRGLESFQNAHSPEDIAAVVRNTAVQGTLSIVFAVVTLIVVAAGIVAIVRALKAGAARGEAVPTSEEPEVASRYFAPSGMVATDVDQEIEKQWAEVAEDDERRFHSTARSHAHVGGH
ncbi:Carbon starvation protein A [Corynebacterium ciconiae DSM 44920]|uniref:carbon starvation CstA family protein n=1 Tax=Corynebacterium ciconiae TaxID=227319 RepID=UPI000364426E|nr:carbon starvation CstA family protein [Corynebacterium ciconiae]WKD62014.1 Carbon starvation protein A [Corynebacterium ciconiae DSM 44920]